MSHREQHIIKICRLRDTSDTLTHIQHGKVVFNVCTPSDRWYGLEGWAHTTKRSGQICDALVRRRDDDDDDEAVAADHHRNKIH